MPPRSRCSSTLTAGVLIHTRQTFHTLPLIHLHSSCSHTLHRHPSAACSVGSRRQISYIPLPSAELQTLMLSAKDVCRNTDVCCQNQLSSARSNVRFDHNLQTYCQCSRDCLRFLIKIADNRCCCEVSSADCLTTQFIPRQMIFLNRWNRLYFSIRFHQNTAIISISADALSKSQNYLLLHSPSPHITYNAPLLHRLI